MPEDPVSMAMPFIPRAARPSKPRRTGVTEIRGPYYSAYGPRHLADLMETMGEHIDGLKYAGGSFALMPEAVVKAMNALAREHGVYVSTGGWIERVLPFGPEAVDRYLAAAKALGFDVVEISAGFVSLSIETMLRVMDKVRAAGLKPKPELGIQFGAGGASSAETLAAEGTRSVDWLIVQARRLIDAGAERIMIESEGITESVTAWRTEVPVRIAAELGLEQVMFEAAAPAVFEWYVKSFGPQVNLFVDHSRIVQLEALRQGIWGTKDTWGRIVDLAPPEDGGGSGSSGR